MFDSLSSIHTIEYNFVLGGATVAADTTSNSHAPPATPGWRRVCQRAAIHSRHAETNSGDPELLNTPWLFPAHHTRALTYDYAYQTCKCLLFTFIHTDCVQYLQLYTSLSLSLSHTLSLSLFVLQSFHKARYSTTSCYKASAQHFPALLRTTKLSQSTGQCNFVLQSFHKALPSTTSYYKTSTQHVPVLLCATHLPQSNYQYYFALQRFRTALPSTTSYYEASTKHFPVILRTTKPSTQHVPVLLCTTNLPQSKYQYYFVLQSFHKALPSTTSYCTASTQHVPVLHVEYLQLYPSLSLSLSLSHSLPLSLCTTKLPLSTAQYDFVLQIFHKAITSTTLYYKASTKHFLMRTVEVNRRSLAPVRRDLSVARSWVLARRPSVTCFLFVARTFFRFLFGLLERAGAWNFSGRIVFPPMPRAELHWYGAWLEESGAKSLQPDNAISIWIHSYIYQSINQHIYIYIKPLQWRHLPDDLNPYLGFIYICMYVMMIYMSVRKHSSINQYTYKYIYIYIKPLQWRHLPDDLNPYLGYIYIYMYVCNDDLYECKKTFFYQSIYIYNIYIYIYIKPLQWRHLPDDLNPYLGYIYIYVCSDDEYECINTFLHLLYIHRLICVYIYISFLHCSSRLLDMSIDMWLSLCLYHLSETCYFFCHHEHSWR